MTYAPIIIPTLNRYQHFKECVESLAACTHADKTELVIGLDYPPAEKYVEGWKQIKEYLPTITGFGKVTIFEHSENLGAVGNSQFLVDYVEKYYGVYIYTEDDNVFSPCFLDYMDKCLDKYKDDDVVSYVCGCLMPDYKKMLYSELKNDNTIIKVIGNANAYGLGVWKNKESKFEKKFPADFRKYIFSSRLRIVKLLKCPAKLNHIYFWIKANPELNRICDFTRNAWMVLHNQVNILPIVSLVRNNGSDGTGENCAYSYEEMQSWNKMKISEKSIYDIVDLMNKNDINRISKKLFSGVTENEKKEIRPIIIKYMIFGYTISQMIDRLCCNMKAYLKSTKLWKKIKKYKK